jgi:hypothetical protein
MKIACYVNRELKVTSPQQLGKIIKTITKSSAWRKDKVRQEVLTDEHKVTRIHWVVKDNPEWEIYRLSWCVLTPEQERFTAWAKRSSWIAPCVLGLETLDIRCLLIDHGQSWLWDDTMQYGPTLREIANMAKADGHTTRIVKPSTLFRMWRKGLIV